LKPEKLQAIKQKVKYDDSLIYFLSVGRIVHDKGIDELLNAFMHVYEKNNRVRVILVGAFEDEVDPISDKAREILKTHPGVIHAGWDDAVEYYMHFSFALIHPSHREGFPNVLLQAGAMHCPIICSRIEGNVDIVEHQKTGLIFEVRNQKQLQEQLEWALENAATMKEYAAAQRKRIEQYFDQPIIHEQLKKRYRELLHEIK
jgi:glycosyltransferase involved in cell wall biosynthesis